MEAGVEPERLLALTHLSFRCWLGLAEPQFTPKGEWVEYYACEDRAGQCRERA